MKVIVIIKITSICRRFASVRHAIGMGASSAVALAFVGCSGGPARVEAPDYDPAGAASRAMQMYDKDEDGFLDTDELESVPGLKAAMRNLDVDKDSKVSAKEIEDRIASWANTNVGLMTLRCEVTLDSVLLDGAKVTFVPEEFLGNVIQEAEATTSLIGLARPRIPKEKRASSDTPPGIQMGFYRVHISKKQGGQELIPARYNTETVLGQEVARDDPAIINDQVRFKLKSK